MLFSLTIFIVFISSLDPSVHVGFVSPGIILFAHTLFLHLAIQHLVKLLMLGPRLVLLVNVLEACFLVLLKALLNVFFLLPHLQFFAIVFYDFAHAIHNGLNTAASLSHLLLSRLFSLDLHFHILFNLISLSFLHLLKLSLSLLLFNHIVLDNLHCSLTLFSFADIFVLFLFL